MGIDLTCGKEFFSTSYSGWNTLRMKFAEYCMKFIEDLSKNELNISPDGVIYAMSNREIIRERVIIEARTIIKEWNDIVEYKKKLSLEPDEEGVDDLQAIVNKKYKGFNINDYLKVYGSHIDYLINIKLKGVVSLLNKSDCEGFYSVGDSYDILQMINIINKMNSIDPEFIQIIGDLNKIFKSSVDNDNIVIIS